MRTETTAKLSALLDEARNIPIVRAVYNEQKRQEKLFNQQSGIIDPEDLIKLINKILIVYTGILLSDFIEFDHLANQLKERFIKALQPGNKKSLCWLILSTMALILGLYLIHKKISNYHPMRKLDLSHIIGAAQALGIAVDTNLLPQCEISYEPTIRPVCFFREGKKINAVYDELTLNKWFMQSNTVPATGEPRSESYRLVFDSDAGEKIIAFLEPLLEKIKQRSQAATYSCSGAT